MTKTLRLGGVEVGRIGLGTNRLTNTPQNVAFIRDAVEAGVSHIDTAYLYTRGQSELTIGTTWRAARICSTLTAEMPTSRILPRSRYSPITPRLSSSGVSGSTR